MEQLELNVFPISYEKHIGFCIIASLFFLLQFIRTKRWYQLVLAIAVPLSLLIYINPENEVIFYGIGIMEGALMLLALVLSIVQSQKEKAKKKAAEAEKKADAEKAESEASGETSDKTEQAETPDAEQSANETEE